MISVLAARNMYNDLGPSGFVRKWYEMLGLTDEHGARRRNEFGIPVLESQHRALRPDGVSLLALGRALCGETLESQLTSTRSHEYIANIMEASDVQPSQFANISAFTSVATGLLEARILESYQKPEFIMPSLVQTITSNKRTEKFIGLTDFGDIAVERNPGRRHARADIEERYVETPETKNRGIAIDVTREAVMFDLTNQLLQQADKVGETLARRKEYLILDVVLGITNTYKYNGTTYNTYLTSGAWVNSHDNKLENFTDLDNALQLFVGMTDPETGEPISITARDMLVMPANYMNAQTILTAATVERRTASAAEIALSQNPVSGMFNLVGGPSYPYAYRRVTATDGLALANDAAKGLWFLGDFKKAFAWISNLPLTTIRANANDYEMADRGLVFSLFADEMGVAAVLEPRAVIKNTIPGE